MSKDESILPWMIMILIITVGILLVLFHFLPPVPDKFIIKNYEGTVVDINSDSITFDNGTILFAYGIKDFDWEMNKSYNATVEYWNRTKNSYIKEVKLLK